MRRTPAVGRSIQRLAPGHLVGRVESASLPLFPREPINTLPTFSVSGKEYATVVVAASNSSADGKAAANYVCDGVLDEDEINAAVQVAYDLGGGRVVLLEGTFVCNLEGVNGAAGLFAANGYWGGVTLEGQGASTVITLGTTPFNSFLFQAYNELNEHSGISGYRIANLVLDGANDPDGYGVYTEALYGVFENLIIRGNHIQNYAQMDLNGADGTVIRNCTFGLTDDPDAEHLIVRSSDCQVEGCVFEERPDNNRALDVEGDRCLVLNNRFAAAAYGIYHSGNGGILSGNVVKSCTTGIRIHNSGDVIVSDNQVDSCDGSIENDFSNGSVIASNVLTNGGIDGLRLNESSDCLVVSNMIIGCGQDTDNLYDGIAIGSDCDRNCVQFNVVRKAGANDHRYGINIADAASDDNMVTNNDLLNSGQTGSLNDAGTGTIIAAGNRT